MNLDTFAKVTDHLMPKNPDGKRRPSRPAQWYGVLALVVFSTFAAKDYVLRGYAWFVKVDTHVDIQSPAAVETFRALEIQVKNTARDVAAVAREQSEQKADIRELRADIRDIHAAVGARRNARRTDDDHEAAQRAADRGMVPPFRFDFLGSAEAADVAGRGPLRSGVRGPADRAGDGRVGKLTEGR
jgi:hypothetical protein